MDFYVDPGDPGATREGPEPILEPKNTKNEFFSFFWIFLNRNRYEPEPVGTEPTRTELGAPYLYLPRTGPDRTGPDRTRLDRTGPVTGNIKNLINTNKI